MTISEQKQRVLNEGLEVLMGRRGTQGQQALRLDDLERLGLTSLSQGKRSGLLASTATVQEVTDLQADLSSLSGLLSAVQNDLNAAEAQIQLAQEDVTRALTDAAAVQANLDAEVNALNTAVATQVETVDARVDDAFSDISDEIAARSAAIDGLTTRIDDADLAITLADQARILGDQTVSLRVDQVELALNSDNLIRTANGNNGVGNWQNATVQADIPAAATVGSESIEIGTSRSVETASGGNYYQGAVRDRPHQISGWVRFLGGGGRFAMIGSFAGNGPGGTDVLAQGDYIAAGAWVALDQLLTITLDIDEWAPGWVLDPGASVRFFNLRMRDTTVENSILANISSTYETQMSATAARAAQATTLRSEFEDADTAAAATAASTFATISSTDTAISQLETDLTAAFEAGDAAALATVATTYATQTSLTNALSALETSLQSQIEDGDAAVQSNVTSGYVTNTTLDNAIALLDSDLRSAFAQADNVAAADADSKFSTISNTSSALASMETNLTADFAAADTAVLAEVATNYATLSTLTNAITSAETTLQSQLETGDADTLAAVAAGYVSNAGLDSALAASRTEIEAKIATAGFVRTPVGDGGNDSVTGWSSFAGTTITSTDLPPGYTSGRSIQIYGRAWETPPILGNLAARRIKYRAWIKAISGSARIGLRYKTPSGTAGRALLGPVVLPTSGWTLVSGEVDVDDVETTEFRADVFSPDQNASANIIRFQGLEIEDATAAREAEAYANETFLVDVTNDSAFVSLRETVTATQTGLVDRIGQVEATYLSAANAQDTFVAKTDYESAQASQNSTLQAQFTTNNQVITPTATDGLAGWSGDIAVSSDIPSGSPDGDKSFRLTGYSTEAPWRRETLLNRKKRIRAWIKPLSAFQMTIGFHARRASNGVVSYFGAPQQNMPGNTWSLYDQEVEIPFGTSEWRPAMAGGGTSSDALVYDVRIEDITETRAVLDTAQAQIEDIRAVSGTANGSALANTLQTLTAEVLTGGGSTLKAQVVNQAGVLADQDGFLQAFAGITAQVDGNGKIAGFKATSYANPDGSQGATLELLGDVIVPGTLAAESLTIGLGRNEIATTMPAIHGLDGWTTFLSANTSFYTNPTSNTWSHPTEGSFVILQNDTNSGSVSVATWRGLTGPDGGLAQGIPVTVGQWVEFSAYISAHRCAGYVQLLFLDASGANLSSGWFVNGNQVDRVPSSSTNLRQWPRSAVVTQVPAGAAYVRPRLIKLGTLSGGNSYLFFARPMFADTKQGAAPTPFSSPSSTYIGPTGISAETVRAKVATFGDLSAIGVAADNASIKNAAITRAKIGYAAIGTLEVENFAITQTTFAVGGHVASFGFNLGAIWSNVYLHAQYILSNNTNWPAFISVYIRQNGSVIKNVGWGVNPGTQFVSTSVLIGATGYNTFQIDGPQYNSGSPGVAECSIFALANKR